VYLTQGLHRSLRHGPNAPATICGDQVRSVAEHVDRVARLAGVLRSLGMSGGDRVAILSLNSDRYVELLAAVPWADGILNPVNIRWSADEITYSLADSETSLLVVDDAFAPMVSELRGAYPGLRAVVHAGNGPAPDGLLSYEDLVAGAAPVSDARRGGDAVAGVFYTGGTTGFPKGVMLTHANLLTLSLGSQATTQWGRPERAAPARRADVPPRGRGDVAHPDDGRRHPCPRPQVRPRRSAGRHRATPRDQHGADPDDAAGARRPPGPRCVQPLQPAHRGLRRIARR
jgi:acyl-CoA synthetase (AMP-forming)/AMP-acid ligase II